MTVKLLRYMQMHKSRHQMHELLDGKQALLMRGVETFYREVSVTQIVEDLSEAHPDALAYLLFTVGVRSGRRFSPPTGRSAYMTCMPKK